MIKSSTIEEMVDDLNNWSKVFLPDHQLQLDKESVMLSYKLNPTHAFNRVCEFQKQLEKLFDNECIKSKK